MFSSTKQTPPSVRRGDATPNECCFHKMGGGSGCQQPPGQQCDFIDLFGQIESSPPEALHLTEPLSRNYGGGAVCPVRGQLVADVEVLFAQAGHHRLRGPHHCRLGGDLRPGQRRHWGGGVRHSIHSATAPKTPQKTQHPPPSCQSSTAMLLVVMMVNKEQRIQFSFGCQLLRREF